MSPHFFVYLWISEKNEAIFVHQNLISDRLTYLVHAKSTGELISFGFSDRSVLSLVSAKRSANRWVQTKKNDVTFWLIFGLSQNLRLSETLSERLIQKVKWPSVTVFDHVCSFQILNILRISNCGGLVICELRTANWRTGNMRTKMRTRPLIGRWCQTRATCSSQSTARGSQFALFRQQA